MIPAGEAIASLTDNLLDRRFIYTVDALTFSSNAPVKDASNPLFGDPSDTWDEDKGYPSTFLTAPSTWRMYYNGHPDTTIYYGCLATSTNGITWTRPNLGQITYAGNTNNNILLEDGVFNGALYDDLEGQWIMHAESTAAFGTPYFQIYTSSDPEGPFTFAKGLTPSGSYTEGKEMVRGPDDRWIMYYVRHGTERRSLEVMRSDTDDLTGTWTELGALGMFNSTSQDRQFYGIGSVRMGDTYYGFVPIFNKTTEKMAVELWVSQDGLDWRPIDAAFLPLGAGGTWDDCIIKGPYSIAVEDDDWHLYYEGWPVTHNTGFPRDRRIGRATVPRGRIGQLSGTGEFVTVPIDAAPGSTLRVNSSAGTIEIEVLDADGDVLAGYARADFDAITTDGFDHAPTWNGSDPMPTDQPIRLRFYLTAATLHEYEVSA